MPSVGFELAIPVGEWLQTLALDREAACIGSKILPCFVLGPELRGANAAPYQTFALTSLSYN